jgi:hypothetical protein
MMAGKKLEEGEMAFNVEVEEKELDESIGEAIDLAKDLELDLAFLNETDETDKIDSEV